MVPGYHLIHERINVVDSLKSISGAASLPGKINGKNSNQSIKDVIFMNLICIWMIIEHKPYFAGWISVPLHQFYLKDKF